MNRLAALLSLVVGGFVVRRLRLGPNDILVLHVPQRLTREQVERITSQAWIAFKTDRVVVLDGGATVEVFEDASSAPA